ncbi:MAG: cobyrinate a,c-diamide synthase [Deltaproteobacteria bacterium]|nr:cobyrinate a,c-diamide synthase [Deltaproteobacteria bacterium]
MKSLIITAPNSGSGKTTFTLGLLRLLSRTGVDVRSFKLGPDYIDKAFLETASNKASYNLDFHLQGAPGVQYLLKNNPTEFAVLEAAMGYFDGIYNPYQNSAYDISRKFEIDAVLVYSPKGEMFSAIPKILGLSQFKESRIKGIIFNNITEKYYNLLKKALGEYSDLEILGYLPRNKHLKLPSRHLGLVQNFEINEIESIIDLAADLIEKHIDIPRLMNLFCQPLLPDANNAQLNILSKTTKPTVAIAKDHAFSFYYHENLDLLKTYTNVKWFSPLKDEKMPDCDLLYLGGGYPEVFVERLAKNESMMNSIRTYGEDGGKIWAECGGFMYLLKEVDGHKMVGLLDGKCHLTDKLQNFGYNNIVLEKDCLVGKAGDCLTSHEFHKSLSETNLTSVFKISKTGGENIWSGGYQYKNVCAGFPHFSFLGNPKMFSHLINHL